MSTDTTRDSSGRSARVGALVSKRPTLHLERRLEPEPKTLVVCPECSARLPRREVEEAWIEVPAGDRWLVGYRLVMKKVGPVIGEIRVFPAEQGRRTAGCWSGDAASVPAGGIPARVIRRVRLTEPIRLFEHFVKKWKESHGEEVSKRVLGRVWSRRSEAPVPKRTGRAGRSDEFYARWAAAYVERLQRGSRRPVRDLATRPPVRIAGFDSSREPEATVRAIIHEARRRKLLTDAPRGRAGGDLTKKARGLIANAR